MKDILTNDFKKELIIYGIRPDLGHKALVCSIIRKCINLGKRVLFYSLEQPKDVMLKRIGVNDTTNLLIKDKLVNNLEDIEFTVDSFNPDIVIIDYFMLLTRDTKAEDIYVLSRIAEKYNIPFIVAQYLNNKELDFNIVTLDNFKKENSKLNPIVEEADRFIVFYQKSPKEYMLRELKNVYGDVKELNIKELLN